VDRVEQSFAKEDAFGGPEIANMARLMASAFLMGGQRGARARKHAKWTVAEWINDPFCYEAAVAAVVDALHAVQPMPYEPKQPKQEDQRVTLPFTATRDTTVFFDGDHLVLLREDGEKDQIPLVQQGEKELSE
jgi:hypothetical protein